MERWANTYRNRAHFLCVGCGGGELAVSMGSGSKLAHATNAFIEQQSSMPSWGQLGCNGFIVFNSGQQEILTPKTSAFMQVRGLAFQHVECILDAITVGLPLPRVCPGQFVKIRGLQKAAELNGQVAICVAAEDSTSGRCTVQVLQGGRKLTVKPVNLVIHDEDNSDAESEDDYESADEQQDSSCGNNGDDNGNSGGCDDNGEVSELNDIASVGVAEMDEQHELCAGALAQLQRTRTVAALEKVLQIYELHFGAEEQLLDQHLYASVKDQAQSGGFDADASSRRTHFADHARMIRNIKQQIRSMKSEPADARIAAQFVSQVLRDFEEHADRYDGSYAERMASSIANGNGVKQSVRPSACVAGS